MPPPAQPAARRACSALSGLHQRQRPARLERQLLAAGCDCVQALANRAAGGHEVAAAHQQLAGHTAGLAPIRHAGQLVIASGGAMLAVQVGRHSSAVGDCGGRRAGTGLGNRAGPADRRCTPCPPAHASCPPAHGARPRPAPAGHHCCMTTARVPPALSGSGWPHCWLVMALKHMPTGPPVGAYLLQSSRVAETPCGSTAEGAMAARVGGARA